MEIQLRPITADEIPAFALVRNTVFGGSAPDEHDITATRGYVELDRSVGAFDGASLVAVAALCSFELTLPGPALSPAAGVTSVGVLPTHRRRGILNAMMRHLFENARERGESLAILTASETSIYGRYGYGIASLSAQYQIDPRYAALIRPVDPQGRCTMIDRTRAADVLPGIYDRLRRRQPAAITRDVNWWNEYLRDPESERNGSSNLLYVIYEAPSGQVDGYVSYRIKAQWENRLPNNMLLIENLVATTPQAHHALWRYCLNVDLVGTVQVWNGPIDEPLRWLLAEPRRLRTTTLADMLWVRLLDIAAALTARRYALEGHLVLEVVDAYFPENSGCYVLEGGVEGASCRRTTAAPDLTLDVHDLGAAYLGGVTFSVLARAGRVVEQRRGALRRADMMFSSEPAPWCVTQF